MLTVNVPYGRASGNTSIGAHFLYGRRNNETTFTSLALAMMEREKNMSEGTNTGGQRAKQRANWIKPQKEPENKVTQPQTVSETWLTGMMGAFAGPQGKRESTYTKGQRSKVTRSKKDAKRSQRRNRR